MPVKRSSDRTPVTAPERTPSEQPPASTIDQLPPSEPELEPKGITGPRKRAPGEPGAVYTSVDGRFRLMQDDRRRFFKFDDEAKAAEVEKDALRAAGFRYDPVEKIHVAPNTFQYREDSDRLALQFDGKGVRLGNGR